MSVLSKLVPLSMAGLMVLVMSSAGAVDLSKVDIKNGEHIFKNGIDLVEHVSPGTETTAEELAHAQAGIEVPPCLTCHGQNAEGNDALGTPRLAGQIYQFLVKQLTDFGTCTNPDDASTCRRQDTTMFVMNNNARGLLPQERLDVAAYLSTLKAPFEPSNFEDLKSSGTQLGAAFRGKALVNFGNVERGISACRSCHDYNGRGVGPIFPMIGQQKFVYLTNQLKKWRDGSRHNDPQEAMQKVARHLTDSDILDVATYLSSSEGIAMSMGEFGTPKRHLPFEH